MTKVSYQRGFPRTLMFVCAIVAIPFPVFADDLDKLAQTLARMRGEVEELQNQLDLDKQDHRTRMQSLSSQVSDLEVEKRRKTLAIEKLGMTIAEHASAQGEADQGDDLLKPVVLDAIAKLQTHVRNGLPFKTQERLSALDHMASQVSSDVLDARRAANQLWAMVEDEVRLTKENGIYQQTIDLNGEKRLADVAKIGMMLLYFQTRDETVGIAQKQNGDWLYTTVSDAEGRKQIASLFDSLKKQVRQGYFELPNPLRSPL